jgi:hypothetical protein
LAVRTIPQLAAGGEDRRATATMNRTVNASAA